MVQRTLYHELEEICINRVLLINKKLQYTSNTYNGIVTSNNNSEKYFVTSGEILSSLCCQQIIVSSIVCTSWIFSFQHASKREHWIPDQNGKKHPILLY